MEAIQTIVTIPVTVKDPLQQEIVRLMGSQGLNRSWRIVECLVSSSKAKTPQAVWSAFGKLKMYGLVCDYPRYDKAASVPTKQGYGRRLLTLTGLGREWYRHVFSCEVVKSEIARATSKRQAVMHATAVLEVLDILRAAGYRTSDDFSSLPARTFGQFKPDLVVELGGVDWPVGVQHELCYNPVEEWREVLDIVKYMVVVLFSDTQLWQQMGVFQDNRWHWQGRLPPGDIVLASIEEMQKKSWEWHPVCFDGCQQLKGPDPESCMLLEELQHGRCPMR